MCFKAKDLVPAVQGTTVALVCKGCWYDVDRIVGYLEFYGLRMTAIPAITPQPPTGDLPAKARKRSKAQDGPSGSSQGSEDRPELVQGALVP